MYRTALSLLIILGLAIASPVQVEKTSQTTHQIKHVPIKAVRSYLNKTRLGARGLVNEFQDVIDSSPQGADVDHHRHIAKGYLPKAIQTIVAMREAADSMLRRIDENGLESPQFLKGKQDCHQLKKSIDAIKEMAIENLCSQLKRQEIIAYFKSDLNCLLGSIFELWRATERDGSYLTLGYRDIIQTIKNLLVAIETGTRRFAEEINYMDFSNECQKLKSRDYNMDRIISHVAQSDTKLQIHAEMPLTPSVKVQSQPSVESKAPVEEGKKKKSESKDEGKGVTGSSVIVAGGAKSGETSLVEKVENVIKLEKKELDDIKAVAKKEMEKMGGKNVNVGVVGIIGGKVGEKVKEAEKAEEKKKEEVEEKKEEAEKAEEKKVETEAEKAEEKKVETEAEKAEEKKVETEAEKAEEKKEAEKAEEKKEAEKAEEKKEAEAEKAEEKKEAEVEKAEEKKEAEAEKAEEKKEVKEAEKEKKVVTDEKKEEKAQETEEKVVEKAATGLLPIAAETNTTEHILPTVAKNNITEHLPPTTAGDKTTENLPTSANHTNENVGGKLKVILTKEENNLNAVLKKLDENNQTTAVEAEKVEEEKKEIKKMQKELEKVIADVVAIEAMEKNKTAEIDTVVAKQHGNVSIIDVITKSPVVNAKLTPKIDLVLPTVVPIQVLPLLTTVKPKLPAQAPTSPETNLKEVENEEKSLENLRSFGNDFLPVPKDKKSDQVLNSSKTEQPKEEAKPVAGVVVDANDIDAMEERDEEERAKEMVEKAKEEKEEKKEQVKEAEKAAEVEKVEEEKKNVKKEDEEEQKKEAATEKKPVAKMATATSKPLPVPAETKNSTFDGLISHINDEEDEVRNLIQKLNG